MSALRFFPVTKIADDSTAGDGWLRQGFAPLSVPHNPWRRLSPAVFRTCLRAPKRQRKFARARRRKL